MPAYLAQNSQTRKENSALVGEANLGFFAVQANRLEQGPIANRE